MEIVSVLRLLRRYWLLLAPGAFFAVLAGASALYHISFMPPGLTSRSTTGGTAVARTLLTAKDSPTFELSKKVDVSGTLGNRAVMLADLMATDGLRKDIARRAGIPASELAVLGPASGAPEIAVPIAAEATAAASLQHEPYLASLTVGASLPIITVRSAAPDQDSAGKLVSAVRDALADALASRSGADAQIGAAPLGPVAERVIINAPKKPLAVIAAALVFGFWCAGIVVLMGPIGRLMRARAATRVPAAA